jgi:hypothetical protein
VILHPLGSELETWGTEVIVEWEHGRRDSFAEDFGVLEFGELNHVTVRLMGSMQESGGRQA